MKFSKFSALSISFIFQTGYSRAGLNVFCFFVSCLPSRKAVANLLDEIREHFYQANSTWIASIRKHLRRNLIDGLAKESSSSKQLSFLSFPVPECSCQKKTSSEKSPHASNPSTAPTLPAFLEATRNCPAWMNSDMMMDQQKDKESEEELEEDDSASLGLFLQQSSANQEGGDGETNNKEETQMEDNEEVEGGDR